MAFRNMLCLLYQQRAAIRKEILNKKIIPFKKMPQGSRSHVNVHIVNDIEKKFNLNIINFKVAFL
jgi:hypothetical protein